jgi:hypothetical protein
MDMRFGAWNVRSLYRAGSLRTVPKEISKISPDPTFGPKRDGIIGG